MWHFRFLFEHLIPYTPFCMIFTQKLWIKSTNPQWKIKIMYFVGTRFCWERIFHHVQLSKSIVFIYTSIHMAGAIFFFLTFETSNFSPTPRFGENDLKRKWNQKFINFDHGFWIGTHIKNTYLHIFFFHILAYICKKKYILSVNLTSFYWPPRMTFS